MKTMIFLVITGFYSFCTSAQTKKVDSALIKKIDIMFRDDQFWRKEFIKVNKKQKSDYSEETIQQKWGVSDSLNELKAKAIIAKYSYPGYDVAGKKSDTFFWIIQHCDDDIEFQECVLVLMNVQIDKNNANKENYAYLTDRVLVNKHLPQIYGTQVHTDPATHLSQPLPLKYPVKVNELRKSLGMEPLEIYLKTFN